MTFVQRLRALNELLFEFVAFFFFVVATAALATIAVLLMVLIAEVLK